MHLVKACVQWNSFRAEQLGENINVRICNKCKTFAFQLCSASSCSFLVAQKMLYLYPPTMLANSGVCWGILAIWKQGYFFSGRRKTWKWEFSLTHHSQRAYYKTKLFFQTTISTQRTHLLLWRCVFAEIDISTIKKMPFSFTVDFILTK